MCIYFLSLEISSQLFVNIYYYCEVIFGKQLGIDIVYILSIFLLKVFGGEVSYSCIFLFSVEHKNQLMLTNNLDILLELCLSLLIEVMKCCIFKILGLPIEENCRSSCVVRNSLCRNVLFLAYSFSQLLSKNDSYCFIDFIVIA